MFIGDDSKLENEKNRPYFKEKKSRLTQKISEASNFRLFNFSKPSPVFVQENVKTGL